MSALAVESDTEFPSFDNTVAEARVEFVAVVERGDGGWGAYVPDLPGVVAAGETEDEVRKLIAEAVEFHLDGLRADGDPVPQSVTRVLWVLG